MAKFGRKLFGLAVISAAAAGAYYYLKKTEEIPQDMDEDDDDFDNFAEDDDADDEEPKAKRSYVNLDFNTIETKAKEVAGKAAGLLSQAGTKVEEFFDDCKKNTEAAYAEVDAAAADACEEAAETVEVLEDACEEATDNITE